jgi:hypothetical protein
VLQLGLNIPVNPAAHVRVVNDVVLVDFGRRTVFRRRVNPNRRDAVLVEAVRPGRGRRVELGVVVAEGGRAVWVPSPDAGPDLFAAFRECPAAIRQTPVSWAFDRPPVVAPPRRGGWRRCRRGDVRWSVTSSREQSVS